MNEDLEVEQMASCVKKVECGVLLLRSCSCTVRKFKRILERAFSPWASQAETAKDNDPAGR